MARPRFKRYLTAEWEPERLVSGMTEDQVKERTAARFYAAITCGFTKRIIEAQRLDDPYVSDNQMEALLWIAGRKRVPQ